MKAFLKILSTLSIILMLSCQSGAAPLPGDERPRQFHLTVLHTNDFHGEDYEALAREAAVIRQIRSEEEHVLYFDAGDVFTRGAYQFKFHGSLEFAVLNALDCSALTLGNNEFKDADAPEKAQATLHDRIAQAEFAVLCANVTSAADGAYIPGAAPFAVLNVDNVKVGVLGVSAARIQEYGQIKGFRVADPVETARLLLWVFPNRGNKCIHVFGSDAGRRAEADFLCLKNYSTKQTFLGL